MASRPPACLGPVAGVLGLFIAVSSLCGQQVVLDIRSIRQGEKEFIVEGMVVMSNLSPGEQMVERDDALVIADIMQQEGGVFPELPDGMVIRPPATAETNYVKGGRFLTRSERDGLHVLSQTLVRLVPRKAPVWREYGFSQWRKNAPNCVISEFSGTLPLEHAGKTVRIRASLVHEWGGPNAAWSAYSLHHDIGHIGTLQAGPARKPEAHRIYIESGPAGSPNPVLPGGGVQCRIRARDSLGHVPLFAWKSFPAAGSFSDPAASDPIWTPPENSMNQVRAYTLSCTVTCPEDPSLQETGSFLQEVCPAARPVSLVLRISAEGFENVEFSTGPFVPRYESVTLTGAVLPAYRSRDEAGRLGADSRVQAELIVMDEGREVDRVSESLTMYASYWLTVNLTKFRGCAKARNARRNRDIRLSPLGGRQEAVAGKEEPGSEEIYNRILAKALEKKGAERLWQLLGLYKAYENDRSYIASGGQGTPALDAFFKNMKEGRVGDIKNAVNTLWEYSKNPLTLGGAAIEDLMQNTNRAVERLLGKGFLKQSGGGANAIRDAGQALKRKLEDFQKQEAEP